nr:elongator complex protein 1 [Leptinotarsa decemlineata]
MSQVSGLLQKKISCVTEKSIAELSWNPAETLLVIIENDYNIYSYTFTGVSFDLKYTSQLTADVPIPVLVGWGSQNTQFRGPKQKHSREGEQSEVKQISLDGPPKLSWRGNGELFVVNFHNEGKRFLKVFDSDLNPLHQSEEYLNLCQAVSFMGQGQCIASCALRNDVNDLIIFEKNCKVKAVFELPEIKGTIKKLLYHPQMNILAVQSTDKEDQTYINILLYSNAKWFLKQQLFYPSSVRVYGFEWLNLQENLFTTCKLVVFTSRNIEHHVFRFIINRCPQTGIVTVINGRTVEFYIFDEKIIPPPMYLHTFEHTQPINRILFHPTRQICALLDCMFQITLLEISRDGIISTMTTEILTSNGTLNFLGWQWNTDENIYLNVQCDDHDIVGIQQYGNISVDLKYVDESSPNFQLQYDDTDVSVKQKILKKDSEIIYLTKRKFTIDNNEQEYDFALASNREFYVNDTVVCNGVTSFIIFREYLIMTHANSKLYCHRLKDFSVFSDNMDLTKLFSREIEQGSRIVSCNNALPPQIILQLPRGNLESIGCKMITIDVAEEMLRKNKWDSVLQILREEKVNMNVLIDLNPVRFSEHIEDFVKAAKSLAFLNTIVTEFNSTENCFDTFYKNYQISSVPAAKCEKLKVVEKILEYLISTDCIHNLSSIIAIQQKHISLHSALRSIKDVYEANPEKNESVCSKALNQLLIQEHFKDVLSASFSFFNLDFLSLVYHNSNEDPKIYEPEIAKLRELTPIALRFRMSMKSGNLKNAVKYLLRCDEFSQEYISEFVVNNKLENAAYAAIRNNHDHFDLVTRLYAKRLALQQKHIEAGFILKRNKLFAEALIQYKLALEWMEVLSLMRLLKYDVEERRIMVYELSESLLKDNRIDEAVILLEHYNKDYQRAVATLTERKCFRRAISMAQAYGAFDVIERDILPDLNNYMTFLMEKTNNFKNHFEKYADRLKTVREEKISKLGRGFEGFHEGEQDLYSESGSTISSLGSSRATSRSRGSTLSSKNRRKEERKKTDLREGGFYEDIALMRALHILYAETSGFGKDIREVCLIVENDNVDNCKELHKKFTELQRDMVKRIPEIWPDVFVKDTETSDHDVLAIIQNKQDLDPKYRTPPSDYAGCLSWALDIFS